MADSTDQATEDSNEDLKEESNAVPTASALFFLHEESGQWRLRALPVFLAFFTLFLVANCQHMFEPAYWDGACGIYRQGAWLANHNFDYASLAEQPGFPTGHKLRVFDGYSLLFALLLKCNLGVYVWLVLHVLSCAWSALAASVAVDLIQRFCKPGLALLWVLAACCQPVFSAQTAGVYVDVPVGACALLLIHCYYHERYFGVAACLVLGYAVKSTMFLLFVVVIFMLIFRLVVFQLIQRRAFSECWSRSHLWIPAGLLVQYSLFRLNSGNGAKFYGAYPHPLALFAQDAPDLATVACLFALLCGVTLLSPKLRKAFVSNPRNFELVSCLATLVFGFLAAFEVFSAPLIRYTVLITLPCAAGLAIVATHCLGEKLSRVLAIVWLSFALVNQWGMLLPAIEPARSRSGYYLERSREWLDDFDQKLQLFKKIDRDFHQQAIVARYPYTLYLSSPELGYVTSQLPNVYQTAPKIQFDGLKDANAAVLMAPDTHFLWIATRYNDEIDATREIAGYHTNPLFVDLRPTRRSQILIVFQLPRTQPLIFYKGR